MTIHIRSLDSGFPRMGDILKVTDSDGTVKYHLIECPHNFGQCAKYVTSRMLNSDSDLIPKLEGKWALCSFRPKELIPYAIDEHAFDGCKLEYIEEKDYLPYNYGDILLKGEFQSVTEAFEATVFTKSFDETAEIRQDFRRFCLCIMTTFGTFLFMIFFAMLL